MSRKPYQIEREQWVPRPPEEVFAFYADPLNLEALTPPWLRFHILAAPATMTARARIDYRITWRGVSLSWRTKITRWKPPSSFVDVQIAGPYRLWHHTHDFESRGGGTLIRDRIRYVLPCGILGRLAHALLIRADLNAIFDYRASKIIDCFGQSRERGLAEKSQ